LKYEKRFLEGVQKRAFLLAEQQAEMPKKQNKTNHTS